MSSQKLLDEVTFIRLFLILLLIVFHAFIVYAGGWTEPAGFQTIPAYWWLDKLSYSFMLETFVFISGYLYAYQRIGLKKLGGGRTLLFSKLKRLILPSIIFSACYFLMFYRYESIANTLYTLLNGAGHLWFLPMLFWCFLITHLFLKVHIPESWRIVILVGLALISFVPFPFRLGNAMYYLLFFYGGYLLWAPSHELKYRVLFNHVIALWCLFLLLFLSLTWLREFIFPDSEIAISGSIYVKAVILGIGNFCQILYATAGIAALYITALYYSNRHILPGWIVTIGNYCFGIYIFQQFFLQFLYYKTKVPAIVGAYWLPWIGFAIALFGSFAVSAILLKTKVGRFLIG